MKIIARELQATTVARQAPIYVNITLAAPRRSARAGQGPAQRTCSPGRLARPRGKPSEASAGGEAGRIVNNFTDSGRDMLRKNMPAPNKKELSEFQSI